MNAPTVRGPFPGWAPSINPDNPKKTVEWTRKHAGRLLVIKRLDKDWFELEVFEGSGELPVYEKQASSETAVWMKAELWIRAHPGPTS